MLFISTDKILKVQARHRSHFLIEKKKPIRGNAFILSLWIFSNSLKKLSNKKKKSLVTHTIIRYMSYLLKILYFLRLNH